jgi:hypothetical protein
MPVSATILHREGGAGKRASAAWTVKPFFYVSWTGNPNDMEVLLKITADTHVLNSDVNSWAGAL